MFAVHMPGSSGFAGISPKIGPKGQTFAVSLRKPRRGRDLCSCFPLGAGALGEGHQAAVRRASPSGSVGSDSVTARTRGADCRAARGCETARALHRHSNG